ncbi:MAG: acyl-CoA thioester hydrolase [Paracrocinitomix sp.]|jgi:acyl-CoA thioester hydrolase
MVRATFPIQVRFYELDPYGHVNHSTYLQYFEAARVAWLGEIGQGLDVLQEEGTQLVVTSVATRFVASALLNDELIVDTSMVRARRVRAQWAQHAWRGDELIACQRINFATVNLSGRPVRIPETLIDAMADFQADEATLAKELPDLAL